jgi:alcohol dehydrogenase class IV
LHDGFTNHTTKLAPFINVNYRENITMEAFEYNAAPSRVIFGSGTLSKLSSEVERLKLSAPLLLSTPQQVDQAKHLESLLDGKAAGLFTEAAMHAPSHITEKALAYAKEVKADSVISIGGGSTIGLGKAISIRTGLPHICIPTTYAGSEMTPILGETQDGKKTTRSDPKILPGTVIYDTDLTMTLPASMSATSGVNAIAHAGTFQFPFSPSNALPPTKLTNCKVEALYARNTNPIISLLALEGTSALATSLPQIIKDPSNVEARQKAQYGAWLCGTCLGAVGMSLHHKLCHTLGGSFNMPHAETHTIILPHALAYNAPAIPEVMRKLAEVLPGSGGDAIKGLNLLLEELQVKRGLKEFGFKEEDVDKAAEIAVGNPYWNPRAVEKEPLMELLRRAWAGEEARADL